MDIIFKTDYSLESFEDISQDVLNNLYCTERSCKTQIDSHVLLSVKQDLKNILTSCNFDIDKVTKLLCSKDWDPDKVECFTSLLRNKKTELIYAALNNHNSLYGETITDCNWLLKLVLGTNDLKTLKYPLLQLILLTIDCKEEQKKLTYDISKDLLQKLINILEAII